jgi:ribosomal-protein-alanine N-acetyltransferase
MALKDSMSLFSPWLVLQALRNRIRRIVSAEPARRNLKMQVLETERLVLRKFHQKDLSDVIAWEESPGAQTAKTRAQEFLDYCFREYREWGFGPWGIQWKETGAIVGNCGFPHIIFEESCGEVNYYIAPGYRGKGLAPEALRALLQFGFRDLGLNRIQARCEPDNLSSERVMQKAGMRDEGWIERAPFSKDPSPKQKLYAILHNEFSTVGNGKNNCTTGTAARSEDRSRDL